MTVQLALAVMHGFHLPSYLTPLKTMGPHHSSHSCRHNRPLVCHTHTHTHTLYSQSSTASDGLRCYSFTILYLINQHSTRQRCRASRYWQKTDVSDKLASWQLALSSSQLAIKFCFLSNQRSSLFAHKVTQKLQLRQSLWKILKTRMWAYAQRDGRPQNICGAFC